MEKLSVEEIISKIKNEETFHAVSSDYSFTLKIDNYVHYVCAAVHDGHQFRSELWDLCLHSEYDRWYEEDPETKNMVQSHPIVLAGLDSRFEYDLNRSPETAVYVDAWGKQLWKAPLAKHLHKASTKKHKQFYRVVSALLETIENKFGCCLVYDMHSYNWKRWDREVPTWNLGTSNVDQKKYANTIENWRESLEEIEFPYGIPSTAKINDTFQGNGYFLKYITENFDKTLVLATEISKIYCDEYEHVIFPEIVALVERKLKNKIKLHSEEFYKTYSVHE